MSHTHTGDVMKEAKKLARWLCDRAKSAGAPTTEAELNTRADTRLPRHFTDDEKTGAVQAALVLFKKTDPAGYERVIANYAGNGND